MAYEKGYVFQVTGDLLAMNKDYLDLQVLLFLTDNIGLKEYEIKSLSVAPNGEHFLVTVLVNVIKGKHDN